MDEPGVATGLAWTSVGGEILFIEATLLPGGSGLTLTGHFLRHHVLEPQRGRLPEARERFFERMRRLAEPHLFML